MGKVSRLHGGSAQGSEKTLRVASAVEHQGKPAPEQRRVIEERIKQIRAKSPQEIASVLEAWLQND